jgi:hypothetical protein
MNLRISVSLAIYVVASINLETFIWGIGIAGRSQWPRVLRLGSAAARLLGLWVRIPPGAWMSVICDCCVLSSRGPWVWLITRPEEFYLVWCASIMRKPRLTISCCAMENKYSRLVIVLLSTFLDT